MFEGGVTKVEQKSMVQKGDKETKRRPCYWMVVEEDSRLRTEATVVCRAQNQIGLLGRSLDFMSCVIETTG
jgi:hypothetical protein